MEVLAIIGGAVLLLTAMALIGGWVGAIERASKEREDAIIYEDERRKVIATRKLFLWVPMPIIFPLVLLYLLFRVIGKGIKNIINVTKDLQLGKNVDKL